jgi:TRAP-type uncharacterized transport system fused permease subunit
MKLPTSNSKEQKPEEYIKRMGVFFTLVTLPVAAVFIFLLFTYLLNYSSADKQMGC